MTENKKTTLRPPKRTKKINDNVETMTENQNINDNRENMTEKQKTTSKKIKKSGNDNREFAVITYMFLGIFLLMMGYLVYFQVFRSEQIINSPYNRRQDIFAEHIVRGKILSADGKTLAETITEENGEETRYYPYGSMFAHAVGYGTKGKSGIESFANFKLLRSHAFFLEQILNGIRNKKNIGDNVVTTLNYELQNAAYKALGNSNGAVIALEPSTGKILAMVSKPDFDPNTISEEWDSIISDTNSSVLVNRVTQGLYPPGSAFKIFTTLGYLQEHDSHTEYSYECTGVIRAEDSEIHCAKNISHGQEDLMTAFAESCNSAYADIGLNLDRKRFAKLCNKLLFHTDLPTTYPSKQSSFSLDAKSDTAEVMQTAIGQGPTLVTPMHLALVTSAIVNDGVLMKPYVVERTENYEGVLVKNYKPSVYGTLLEAEECQILQKCMEKAVSDGTGAALAGKNYTAAGKTGSAEYSNTKGKSHAWFTGYASNEEAGEIVITVIVEDGGFGSDSAVPIAKTVFDTYFQ